MCQVTEQKQYIGKYMILKQLGKGGEGNVYLAKDTILDRLAAVKKLQMRRPEEMIWKKEQQSKKQPEVLKRREEAEEQAGRTKRIVPEAKEAETLQQLRHPMLPVVYELFEEDGWYLAMEYIQGVTLRRYVENSGCVQEAQARVWAEQLLDVLAYLHSRKPSVIYRDLKPDNIMVCHDGYLRLVDFGAACRQEFGMASDRLMAATPGYGAPEQFGRNGCGICADERSDIYAFGKVLYYMVTGADPAKPPYGVLSVRDYQPLLGSDLERVIRKCIEDEPKNRYQTAGQIGKALERGSRRNTCLRRRSWIRLVEKQVWLTENSDYIRIGITDCAGMKT